MGLGTITMRLTKKQLKQFIKEELHNNIEENNQLEELAPAVELALETGAEAIISFISQKLVTSEGRNELADLYEMLPKLVFAVCEVGKSEGEGTFSSAARGLCKLTLGSLATAFTGGAFPGLLLAIKVLRNMSDEHGQAVADLLLDPQAAPKEIG